MTVQFPGFTLPLKSPSADTLNHMSARKLIYRCMVFAPAVFLVGLGAHARISTTDYEFIANDYYTEQLVLAYVPYLRASSDFIGGAPNGGVEAARKAASLWISGAEKGELKPLNPIAYEDTSSEGAKSQVFETQSKITARLIRGVASEIQGGDYHSATLDVILVVKLSGTTKYSDFVS